MDVPERNTRIELSSGEPGGSITINGDHVLRRIAASPWNAVRPLLEANQKLCGLSDLIPWAELDADDHWVLLRHPRVRVISYPHEWCAEMLHKAALAHCRLLASVAEQGMALKDAHPWNVLFDDTREIFIDVGSIVPLATLADLDYLKSTRGRSHPALAGEVFRLMFLPYFLLPLVFHHVGLGQIARSMLWRFPLNGATRHPRLSDYVLAAGPRHWRPTVRAIRLANQTSSRFDALCEDLERSGSLGQFAGRLADLISDLAPPRSTSAYSTYYAAKGEEVSLDRPDTWNFKQLGVRTVLDQPEIRTVLDVASNTGWYSRLAARLGKQVIAIDIDDACISELFRNASATGEGIVPLVADLTRPTPNRARSLNGELLLIGSERRLRGDIVLALGILHHLVLGAGISLADALTRLGAPAEHSLLIEFVGLDDELVASEPGFFRAYSRNPEAFAGFTLTATQSLLTSMGWEVSVLPSFPETRSLLACKRKIFSQHSS